ncbi:MAG: OmpA family protein [Rhodocyclaceae bacterium]
MTPRLTSPVTPPCSPRLIAPPRRLAAALLCALLCALLLAACATPQASNPGRTLSEAQIAALIQAGFAQTDEGWGLNLDGRILFDTDTDTLSNEARGLIARIADALRLIEIDDVLVEGHTDNVGDPAYNQALSLRRADAVARELATHGIADDRIARRGHGSSRPIADNRSAEGRAQNRRVAIVVLAG